MTLIDRNINRQSQADRDLRTLEAFCFVYQRVVRIMSGDVKATVRLVDAPSALRDAPGWTDGRNVSINKYEARDLVRKTPKMSQALATLKGLTYHELGHNIFTPTNDSEFMVKVLAEGLHRSFNMLEDQRMELLVTTKYTVFAMYFRLIINEWIVAHPSTLTEVFPLTHGRRYLSYEMRKDLRRMFTERRATLGVIDADDLADQIANVIDQYLVVDPIADPETAVQLVRDFDALMAQLGRPATPGSMTDGHYDGTSGTSPAVHKAGSKTIKRKANAEQQEYAEEKLDEELADEAEADAKADSDKGKPGKGKGKSDSKSDADAKGEGESDSDAPQPLPTKPGDKGHDGIGGEAMDKDMAVADEIVEAAQKALDEILNSDTYKAEARDTMKSVQSIVDDEDGAPDQSYGRKSHILLDPTMKPAVSRAVEVVSRIRSELEAHWEGDHASGRLDMNAAIQREIAPGTNPFRQWNEGSEEAAGLETVLLLDFSGSMSWNAVEAACQAGWCIKRIHEEIGMPCTVLGFDGEMGYIYRASDITDAGHYPRHSGGGGTRTLAPLQAAAKVFHYSKQANKVMMVLTDGGWEQSDRCDKLVAQMNGEGIVTVLGTLDGASAYGTHNCQIAMPMENPKQLVPAMEAIVAEIMNNAGRR